MTEAEPRVGVESTGFDVRQRTRLVYGAGSLERLGELTAELGGSRVLLVTDPGIVAAGHAERARSLLGAAGLRVAVFDRVRENPTTLDVARCLEAARAHETELFVALGGGSSIDAAKGANFLLTNGGEVAAYRGYGRAVRPLLPLVAVPTTAGTGSEVQSYALIAEEATHRKMACGDPTAAPAVALLDPVLTLSQPARVTACTGIDALAHAIESAVTRRRNASSLLHSREAFRLCLGALGQVMAHPDDLEARARMQLGAAFAGIAIEQSMLGAAHSAANPLTARYEMTHGEAVGRMLPTVIRYNAASLPAATSYAELALLGGLVYPGRAAVQAPEALAAAVEALLEAAGFSGGLAARGVTPRAIPELAAEAAEQWTASFNPREVTAADFEVLFHSAL